jgi:hypothetical protein
MIELTSSRVISGSGRLHSTFAMVHGNDDLPQAVPQGRGAGIGFAGREDFLQAIPFGSKTTHHVPPSSERSRTTKARRTLTYCLTTASS